MADEPSDRHPRMLKQTHPAMRGEDVEALQKRLKALGFEITSVDGIFGPELDRAVRAFQEKSGLTVDGIVGPRTFDALDRAGAERTEENASSPAEAGDRSPERVPSTRDASRSAGTPSPPSQATAGSAPLGRPPLRETLLAAFTYAGLSLARGTDRTDAARDLQRHLRALGYLRAGIDGAFGAGTEDAIRALQHDLLHNDGADAHGETAAPVKVADYNRGRVREVTGVADADTVACIRDMISDSAFTLLPAAENAAAANARIRQHIEALPPGRVPVPFLEAILKQESGLRHFNIPRGNDEDTYIVVGCDRNDSAVSYRITSRGYGAGQYTLFHHPPRQEEVEQFMLEAAGNVQRAVDELRDKFDRYVNGATSGTRSDDRVAEIGTGPLRLCKYEPGDPRHLTACAGCMEEAGTRTIESGTTPFYAGASGRFEKTQYHNHDRLADVPVCAKVGCDWPYAVRRYNGSGVNSYWYQAEVLLKIKLETDA